MFMARNQRVLTGHDEIRQWAEERKASPACVRGTGGSKDIGMLRLDFPGYSGETSLEHIEWDEWFSKFDEKKLALLVEGEGGKAPNFNKLVARGTAAAKRSGSAKKAVKKAAAKKAAPKKTAAKKATKKKAAVKKAPAKKKTAGGRKR
jgi:hypothetical protein